MDTKKHQVILTAQKLFKDKGFNTSSVQDIIDTCNISKGTFYNYFTSKNNFIISYLDAAHADEHERRNALLAGNDIKDKEIFVQQILVRIKITKEYALRPIFEYAFHSKDEILKSFIENRLIEELSWLAKRITDFYGVKSAPYAVDGAVFLLGMIQHLLHVWKMLKKEQINMTLLVQFVTRRLDELMENLMKKDDGFLRVSPSMLPGKQSCVFDTDTIEEIRSLQASLGREQTSLYEHLDFLLEEMGMKQPRISVINSILTACLGFTTTKHEKAVIEGAQKLLAGV